MMAKPRIIYWMCLCLVAVVFAVPLQAAIIYQHSFLEIAEIFYKLSYPNWVMMGSILLTIYFLYHVSPFLKIFAPLTILTIAWNNYLVGEYGQDFPLYQTLAGTALCSMIFAPLFKKEIRQLLNDPRRRWWNRAKRLNKSVDVTLNPYVGQTLMAHTFDLSESGAFIPFENVPWSEIPKVGERLKVSLQINTLRKIKGEAIVVRAVEARGSYPQGIGIRFIELDGSSKKNLSQFLDH